MRHYCLGWLGWLLQLWGWWWGRSTTWCCRGRSHLERCECKRLARECCGTAPPSRSCHDNSSNPPKRQEIEHLGKIQNIYIDWSTWKRCPASTLCQHRSLSSTWSDLRPRILYWLIFRRAHQPTFHVGFAQLVGIGQTIIGPLLPGNRGQRLNKRSSCHLKVIWTLYSILTSSIFAKLRMNRFTMIKVASSEKINQKHETSFQYWPMIKTNRQR